MEIGPWMFHVAAKPLQMKADMDIFPREKA
jgi:hypothetical protein